MSLQRQFDRGQPRKNGEPWPKSAKLDARNESLAVAGLHLHPTKGFRTRREWRDTGARDAVRRTPRRSFIDKLLGHLIGSGK